MAEPLNYKPGPGNDHYHLVRVDGGEHGQDCFCENCNFNCRLDHIGHTGWRPQPPTGSE